MKVKIVRPWLWTIRTPLLVPAALMALALVDVAARNAGAQPGAIVLTLAFAGYVALIPVAAGARARRSVGLRVRAGHTQEGIGGSDWGLP